MSAITGDVPMTNETVEQSTSAPDDDSRKKPKQTHTKVFQLDLPGVTNNRADSPTLLHTVVDFSNGSDGNPSQIEGDHASMRD